MTVVAAGGSPKERDDIGEVVTFADPALGSTFSTTVPDGFAWRIFAAGSRLVCSAVAGNRSPQLKILQGSLPIYNSALAIAMTANQDRRIVYYDQRFYYTSIFASTWYPIGLRDMWLPEGTTISFSVSGMQSGDQMSDVMMLVQQASV